MSKSASGATNGGRKVRLEDLEKIEFETSEDVQVLPSFDRMKLKEDLLRGIYGYGFERPSAIQQRAIVPIVSGRDVIAQSQSGTGKTATFSISMLQMIDTKLRETQALVLSPTRELAVQIESAVQLLRENDREIILMRHYEQLNNQEIAQSLGLTEPAASMRYLRALKRLREVIEGQPTLHKDLLE